MSDAKFMVITVADPGTISAIEAAYDAVQADNVYQETLPKLDLGMRNIVRLLG